MIIVKPSSMCTVFNGEYDKEGKEKNLFSTGFEHISPNGGFLTIFVGFNFLDKTFKSN